MTLLRTNGLILLMAISACLLAGCSEKDPGTPSAESTTRTGTPSSGTSTTTADSGLPELALDTFKSDPCQLLKTDQVAELGTFKAPVKSTNEVAVQCRWGAQDVTKGATYTVAIATTEASFDSASAQAKQKFPVFTLKKVLDYPAYSADATDAKGACTTGVGTPSKGVFLVQIIMDNEKLPEYNNPCAATEKAAEFVVKNLKG